MPNIMQNNPASMQSMVALVPQSSPAPLIVNGLASITSNNNNNNVSKQVNMKSTCTPTAASSSVSTSALLAKGNQTSITVPSTTTVATTSLSSSSTLSPPSTSSYTSFFNRFYRGSSTASIQQANEKLIGAQNMRPVSINVIDTRHAAALPHQSTNCALMPQINFVTPDNARSNSSYNN